MKYVHRATVTAVLFAAVVVITTAGAAEARKRLNLPAYAIGVADTVYGDYTVAFVTPDEHEDWVFVQCYTPDGTYVYAAWFPVLGPEVEIGPLWATTWPPGPASCLATQGYFTRDGFGKWSPHADTTFDVAY